MQALPSKSVNILLERPWIKKDNDQLLARGLQTPKVWIYHKSWIEGKKKSQIVLQDLIYDQTYRVKTFFFKKWTYCYFSYLFSVLLQNNFWRRLPLVKLSPNTGQNVHSEQYLCILCVKNPKWILKQLRIFVLIFINLVE